MLSAIPKVSAVQSHDGHFRDFFPLYSCPVEKKVGLTEIVVNQHHV